MNVLLTSRVVTKKKSRYVGFDWKAVDVDGNLEADTVKGIFGMTHHIGAKFRQQFYDPTQAKALKAKAAVARGVSGAAAELATLEGFLSRKFAT